MNIGQYFTPGMISQTKKILNQGESGSIEGGGISGVTEMSGAGFPSFDPSIDPGSIDVGSVVGSISGLVIDKSVGDTRKKEETYHDKDGNEHKDTYYQNDDGSYEWVSSETTSADRQSGTKTTEGQTTSWSNTEGTGYQQESHGWNDFGTSTYTAPDGTRTEQMPDGTTNVISPDGSFTTYYTNGMVCSYDAKTGKYTTTFK